jgi:2-hydroxychromene-2-carboxylate isomerase
MRKHERGKGKERHAVAAQDREARSPRERRARWRQVSWRARVIAGEVAARGGVPGTPAFLINGRPFFGAQRLSAFEAVIAQARRSR